MPRSRYKKSDEIFITLLFSSKCITSIFFILSQSIISGDSIPSPQKLSFLRCLPYIALQLPVILRDTAGRRGVILLETRSERCITLSPCVPVREYRGSAHWARGLTFTVKNLLSSFLPPLLSNYRFFGVSPMLLCNSP